MNPDTGDLTDRESKLEAAIKVIGGKWKLVALAHLSGGSRRFNELRGLMPNTTPRMLTITLRELERDGLVTRTAYSEIPPRVEYALTHEGRALIPTLETLRAWSAAHIGDATTQPSPLPAAPAAKAHPEPADRKPKPVTHDRDTSPPSPGAAPRSVRPWGATAKAKIT